jgi:hypothetical protein
MVLLARVLNILIRFFAAGALILGLAFWLSYALSFTRLHIALGIGLVASLWLLAAIVWKEGWAQRTHRICGGLGAISWLFGFAHTRLLLGTGRADWAQAHPRAY